MSEHGTSLPPINADRVFSVAIRMVVWWTFFAILYVLKAFFLLIFLTFVFGYIQSSAVERLQGVVKGRTVRVVLVALVLLGLLIGLGSFIAPKVREEAYGFVEKLPSYIQATDQEVRRVRKEYPVLQGLLPETEGVSNPGVTDNHSDADLKNEFMKSPTGVVLHRIFNLGSGENGNANFYQTVDTVRNLGAYVAGVGSAFFLSLLFSFLIVLDLPRLTASARSLRSTKIGFVYNEVAPSIANFSRVMGKALEAQLFIALLNTFLTGLGMLALGLGSKLAFLSLIVFCCSFIPVAGVVISSIPICLVALQQGGLTLALLAVLIIIIAHFIETYILNPRIYGHHLRMNPVIVLIILTIGGKMFHVWGLVLGVPICTYIFGHAIQYRSRTEDAQVAGALTGNE